MDHVQITPSIGALALSCPLRQRYWRDASGHSFGTLSAVLAGGVGLGGLEDVKSRRPEQTLLQKAGVMDSPVLNGHPSSYTSEGSLANEAAINMDGPAIFVLLPGPSFAN